MPRKVSTWSAWFVGLAAGLALMGGHLFADTPSKEKGATTDHKSMGHKVTKKAFRIVDATFASVVQDVKSSVLTPAIGGALKADASSKRHLKQARTQVNNLSSRMLKGLAKAAKQIRKRGVPSQFMRKTDTKGMDTKSMDTRGMDTKKMEGKSGQEGKAGQEGKSGQEGKAGQESGRRTLTWSRYTNYTVNQFQNEFLRVFSYAVQDIIPANVKFSPKQQKQLRNNIVRTYQDLLRRRIRLMKRTARSEISLVQRSSQIFYKYNKQKKKAGAQ